MGTHFRARDLERLRTLRQELLGLETRPPGTEAARYWRSPQDLELYDSTFGRRIAWKWSAVLAELEQRDLLGSLARKPEGEPLRVLDWGCGTGVASRAWLERSGPTEAGGVQVALWDRHGPARELARERLATEAPQAEVSLLSSPPDATHPPDLLLLSHVLDELRDDELEPLLVLATAARAVLWVEPGSRITSRRLSTVRERLRSAHRVLAPCPHQAACGMLAAENERHWCHLFGKPPQEAFTDGRWAELKRELSLDLRSLPYAFLALARAEEDSEPAPDDPRRARLLGRPRVRRGAADVDLCRADGVHDVRLLQRTDKALFKALTKDAARPWWLRVELDGGRVSTIEPEESSPRPEEA